MASSENEIRRKDNAQCQKQRQSHREMSKSDMLQLLGHLETELQARDRVIATLKAERAKQFLYQAKYGHFSLSDPLYLVQRDSDFERASATKSKYDDPMSQLDKLIEKQHEAENQMKEQLHVIDKRYEKVCTELEEEKWKHDHDLEQGDSVVFMLEKDQERLQHEIHGERSQNKNLESEVQLASDELKKFAKHREVVVKLLKKRSQIVKDINDTQCNITSLEDTLREAESEAKTFEGCITNECLKHLHIESVTEQQLGVAAREHGQLLSRLSLVDLQNRELNVELDKLRSSVSPRYRQNPVAHDVHGSLGAPISHNLTLLNENVSVMNDRGTALQTKRISVISLDSHSHSLSVTGDVKLFPAKVTPVTAGRVPPMKSSVQMSGLSSTLKLIGSHRIVPMTPAAESVKPSAVASVATNLVSHISLAVSGPSSQICRQVPTVPAAPLTGRGGVPPPVPPNKPQVLITQPRLPVLPASSVASRAIPVAQPLRPQNQMRYEIAFPQDRSSGLDKPTLTAAVATGSRQAPAPSSRQVSAPSSQAATSSRLAMVVGETSTVHKHPSQVCVNIK